MPHTGRIRLAFASANTIVDYKIVRYKIAVLIDWCLTHFMATSSSIHVFPGFLTPVLHKTVFQSNWLLFHIDC